MSTTTMTRSEGKRLAMERKAFRRAANAGRADWSTMTVAPEMPIGPPVAPKRVPLTTRRTFGQGLGERHPVYLSPVPISDMEWWDEECRKAEERDLEMRAGAAMAQDRLESGWLM